MSKYRMNGNEKTMTAVNEVIDELAATEVDGDNAFATLLKYAVKWSVEGIFSPVKRGEASGGDYMSERWQEARAQRDGAVPLDASTVKTQTSEFNTAIRAGKLTHGATLVERLVETHKSLGKSGRISRHNLRHSIVNACRVAVKKEPAAKYDGKLPEKMLQDCCKKKVTKPPETTTVTILDTVLKAIARLENVDGDYYVPNSDLGKAAALLAKVRKAEQDKLDGDDEPAPTPRKGRQPKAKPDAKAKRAAAAAAAKARKAEREAATA